MQITKITSHAPFNTSYPTLRHMAEAMETRCSTSIDAMIRGYNEYKSIWEAEIDEELQCKSEPVNVHDPYAVKAGVRVGQVARKISALCSTFIRKGGAISCCITGSRQYASDLPQGGLEIPCIMKFVGNKRDDDRVNSLALKALNYDTEPPPKKAK